jgi:hypothetical protein
MQESLTAETSIYLGKVKSNNQLLRTKPPASIIDIPAYEEEESRLQKLQDLVFADHAQNRNGLRTEMMLSLPNQ